MLPLAADLLVSRVRARVEAGDISDVIGARLLIEHDAHHSHRKGMIWFIFTRSLLAEEIGVGLLLPTALSSYSSDVDLCRKRFSSPLKRTAEHCFVIAVVHVLMRAKHLRCFSAVRVAEDHQPPADRVDVVANLVGGVVASLRSTGARFRLTLAV
jgi:hypothetical protein